MRDYFEVLKSVALFEGIDSADLGSMLDCLGAKRKTVAKDEIVLLAGERPRDIGIILMGQLHIIREDYDGNRSLIAAVAPGEIYADTLCCASIRESPETVIANTPSTVLLLHFTRVLHVCPNTCSFHEKLIENMLRLIAGKHLLLQSHLEIISLKSVRAKVMRYLETFRAIQGSEITVPFNREDLANYLCVDRSALSHELMKMKHDGLIEYSKNRFSLLEGRISN